MERMFLSFFICYLISNTVDCSAVIFFSNSLIDEISFLHLNVLLFFYRQGIMLCNVINEYMGRLAGKFPTVKFIRSISTTCIPNYPDSNLPTIFIYYEGKMKTQLVGPMAFRGTNMKIEEFEYILGKTGAIETDIKSDPRPKVKDVMMAKLGHNQDESDNDSDPDW